MGLIAQQQQTPFANPQNGQSPIDADVVRLNDNALTAKHNAHDADATLHVQTGTLAARPAAGTLNAMYLDENGRFYRDNGTTWNELPYARLDAAGTNAFTNNITVGGTLGVTGTTTLGAVNVSGTATLGTVDAGAVSATSFTGTHNGSASGLTGIPAAQLTGSLPAVSGASLTGLNASNIATGTLDEARISTLTASKLTGALPAISGASLTNLNGSNVATGTVAAARLPATLTAGTTVPELQVTQGGSIPGIRFGAPQPNIPAIRFDDGHVYGGGGSVNSLNSYPLGWTHQQWLWIRVTDSSNRALFIPASQGTP